jgi:hypothetical protein
MKKLTFAVVLSCFFGISARGDCGKKTTEKLAHSSESEIVNAGELRSIRGRVLYPNGTKAELMIVEIYRIDLATPLREINYAEVSEIVKRGRMAAVETGESGKFCFKNLKAGNYLLRVNASGEGLDLSGFRMTNILLRLTPTRKNAQPELTVQLAMAI